MNSHHFSDNDYYWLSKENQTTNDTFSLPTSFKKTSLELSASLPSPPPATISRGKTPTTFPPLSNTSPETTPMIPLDPPPYTNVRAAHARARPRAGVSDPMEWQKKVCISGCMVVQPPLRGVGWMGYVLTHCGSGKCAICSSRWTTINSDCRFRFLSRRRRKFDGHCFLGRAVGGRILGIYASLEFWITGRRTVRIRTGGWRSTLESFSRSLQSFDRTRSILGCDKSFTLSCPDGMSACPSIHGTHFPSLSSA